MSVQLSDKSMTIIEHLTELKKRLVIIVVANLLVAIISFNYVDIFMGYLLALNTEMQLVYISPSELFLVYIQIAIIAAIVICSPITIYQIYAFVKKGLYKRERLYILVSLFFGLICFAIGTYFCYMTVLPITLEFFTRIAIDEVSAMISVKSYTSFVNVMLLSFGVVFEMPVIIFLLTQLNIIKPEYLIKNRGMLIVVIFILAAVITPPDVISQLLLAIPMLILLQLSIFISSIVYKRNLKIKKKAEEN